MSALLWIFGAFTLSASVYAFHSGLWPYALILGFTGLAVFRASVHSAGRG